MSNTRKALGSSLESRVVQRAQKAGLLAARQPGSGVYADYPNDVVVDTAQGGLLVECKVRSTTPSLSQLLLWLHGCQSNAQRAGYGGGALVYNAKGSRRPVVLIDLDLFLSLLSSEKEVDSCNET
jgi:hypothetical protein